MKAAIRLGAARFFSCDTEYVDVYSELESADQDLLSAPMASRFCGTVSVVAPSASGVIANSKLSAFFLLVSKRKTAKIAYAHAFLSKT